MTVPAKEIHAHIIMTTVSIVGMVYVLTDLRHASHVQRIAGYVLRQHLALARMGGIN